MIRVVTHVSPSIIGMWGVLSHDVTWEKNIASQIIDFYFHYSFWVEITLSLPTIMNSIIVGPLIIALVCIAFYIYSKYEAMAWRTGYLEPRIQATEEYYRRPITPVILASHEYCSYAAYRITHGMAWQRKRRMMHLLYIHPRVEKSQCLHGGSQ